MTLSFASLNEWQQLLLVSQRMLAMAKESKWDDLISGELEYIQLVESLAQKSSAKGNSISAAKTREILRELIENESEVKRLLLLRMEELKVLIHQGNQQQSINNTYGGLAGMLLLPNAQQ